MAVWPKLKGLRVLPETERLPCFEKELVLICLGNAHQISVQATFSEGGFFHTGSRIDANYPKKAKHESLEDAENNRSIHHVSAGGVLPERNIHET